DPETEEPDSILEKESRAGLRELREKQWGVVGGTVYQLSKADEESFLDLLIVDEASQMKFGELSLVSELLAADGRLVMAGDDLQLPPIINGEYPEPADGRPPLHGSVFAYARGRDEEPRVYTYPLQENWRMNSTLSRFPASTIYFDEYGPANPAVAGRSIKLDGTGAPDTDRMMRLCEWLCDPDYPMVLCIMENVRAVQANPVEAFLAANVAAYLRDRLLDSHGRPYPVDRAGDALFWKEGLFIVSPHHAQIHALRKELDKVRSPWHSSPFVDTVDKMQGQESQVVLVSYGVSDQEAAEGEADFIYSLNRLNVAVTRAKAKCIVFLSRPLLEPSCDLLQNDETAAGVDHMLNLLEFCRHYGEKRAIPLDFVAGAAGAALTVMRARV
ncbi:MAG: DEAD/DEAH box helicase, partial [Pseudomonadota bacterium]